MEKRPSVFVSSILEVSSPNLQSFSLDSHTLFMCVLIVSFCPTASPLHHVAHLQAPSSQKDTTEEMCETHKVCFAK